jgi:hypothetical protein
MNERIKELEDQATTIYEKPVSGGWQKAEYFDKEKFAELIVKECAYIAKHHVSNISTYSDAEFVDEQIKQHFGVEE